MTRSARTLHVEALEVLLKGRMAEVAVARNWDCCGKSLVSRSKTLRQSWRPPIRRCSPHGAPPSQNIPSRGGHT